MVKQTEIPIYRILCFNCTKETKDLGFQRSLGQCVLHFDNCFIKRSDHGWLIGNFFAPLPKTRVTFCVRDCSAQTSGSNSPGSKKAKNASLDLLGLGAVDGRVHQGREQQVDITHDEVDNLWDLLPKPMDQRQPSHGDIENQDTADMRDTGVEGLDPLFSGGKAQDGPEDQHIGDKDDQRVQHKYKSYKHHWIQSIEGGVRTGQFDDILVKAECVGKHVGVAIWKKVQGQDWGDDRDKPPHQNAQPHLHHSSIGEYGGISEGVANGNKTITSHSEQNARFYKGKGVYEVGLREAGYVSDLPVVQPEDSQHRGHRGQGQPQVCGCQHGQKVVHGLVKTVVFLNEKEEGAVA